MVRRPLTDDEFWALFDRSGGEAACWPWLRYTNPGGYGVLKRHGRVTFSHRVAYEIATGQPIADGLVIDHTCRNRACANPRHLEAVTDFENRARGARSPLADACIHGHRYTPENTYMWRGKRNCRTCHRLREAAKRGAAR